MMVVTDKPRVISELKKTSLPRRRLTATSSLDDSGRSKISGEVLWSATPTQWHVKFAEVRHGSLFVYCSDTGVAEFRLPLHHLNLQPSRTPRTFTLATGHGIPLATFQTLTEEEYHRWVRVLAVEVLRQTPIQDVRFLDIIGITRNERGMRRGRSEECLSSTAQCFWETSERTAKRNKYNFRDECKKKKERSEFSQWLNCVKRETQEENLLKNTDFDMKNMKIRRAQRVRPKLPFAEMWKQIRGIDSSQSPSVCRGRSVSMENLKVLHEEPIVEVSKCARIEEKSEVVSDESGISSGDENNNTIVETQQDGESKDRPDGVSVKNGTNAIVVSASAQHLPSFVSVREKKKFFESLGGEKDKLKIEVTLNRSNSIGNVAFSAPPVTSTLRASHRASSMQNLTGNSPPVKEMRRLFEKKPLHREMTQSCENLAYRDFGAGSCSSIAEPDEDQGMDCNSNHARSIEDVSASLVKPVERKPKELVSYANIQFCRAVSKPFQSIEEEADGCCKAESTVIDINALATAESLKTDGGSDVKEGGNSMMSTLLIQRKLQRGERKLGKLRIQIAEVEETIKIIAEDLHSIGPDTLKKRKGLEVFAALRRRLEEESSRLQRLQEETAKVIAENQRTIVKMSAARNSKLL